MLRHMTLNLNRRHRKECTKQHPHNSLSSEAAEKNPRWKHCSCPIIVSGKLGGEFNKRVTEQAEWSEAYEVARRLQQLGHWPDTLPQVGLPGKSSQDSKSPDSKKKPITDAVAAFLKDHDSEESAHETRRMNRYFMDSLMDFSSKHGLLFLEEWESETVRAFQDAWSHKGKKNAGNTRTKKMAMLRSFFNFCLLDREWITKNPALSVRKRPTRKNRSIEKGKKRVPFSDVELDRMLAACDTYGTGPGAWRFLFTGEDLRDFILVSLYTGLRISDVAMFDADKIDENGLCEINPRKTQEEDDAGEPVRTSLPVWLHDRVKARVAKHGRFIFGEHNTEDVSGTIADQWRRKLKRLWASCGPWNPKPDHHRFRHTFARILLQSGSTVADVAKLIGDTEETVRKYYSQWVRERQDELTRRQQAAFAGRTLPGLPSPGQPGMDAPGN